MTKLADESSRCPICDEVELDGGRCLYCGWEQEAVPEIIAALRQPGAVPGDLVEPSNAEQASWPDATRDYVHGLEAAIQSLTAERDAALAANYKSFTDGMETAAQICGSLAETTYDDTDAFEAATGCEASIMGVVKQQRAEQPRALLEGSKP